MRGMPNTDPITFQRHFGRDCLRIATRHSIAIVALHGGQLLSWVPHGARDVLWRSRLTQAPPAPLRGGVPICWPWFGRQGPAGSAAHGHARTAQWQLAHVDDRSFDSVRLTLKPRSNSAAAPSGQLSVALTITVSDTLSQTLTTRNLSQVRFALTQALHSYFAVGDATQIGIDGITGASYHDKALDQEALSQVRPFQPGMACDRIYFGASGCYRLNDPVWGRRILIQSSGSQSLVVWNPGTELSKPIADLESTAWRDFYCIEVANAGPDAVLLASGAEHRLTQTIRVQPLSNDL